VSSLYCELFPAPLPTKKSIGRETKVRDKSERWGILREPKGKRRPSEFQLSKGTRGKWKGKAGAEEEQEAKCLS